MEKRKAGGGTLLELFRAGMLDALPVANPAEPIYFLPKKEDFDLCLGLWPMLSLILLSNIVIVSYSAFEEGRLSFVIQTLLKLS